MVRSVTVMHAQETLHGKASEQTFKTFIIFSVLNQDEASDNFLYKYNVFNPKSRNKIYFRQVAKSMPITRE